MSLLIFLLVALIILIILLIGFIVFLLYPFLFGAGFEATDKKSIETMLKLAQPKKIDKVADLGSGTGNIVIAFAKKGIQSVGFEINPLLVWYSRRRIRRLGLSHLAKIHRANFFHENLSRFSIITIFQYSYVMPKLESHLPKNARILSNKWLFPSLKPKKKQGRIIIYKT